MCALQTRVTTTVLSNLFFFFFNTLSRHLAMSCLILRSLQLNGHFLRGMAALFLGSAWLAQWLRVGASIDYWIPTRHQGLCAGTCIYAVNECPSNSNSNFCQLRSIRAHSKPGSNNEVQFLRKCSYRWGLKPGQSYIRKCIRVVFLASPSMLTCEWCLKRTKNESRCGLVWSSGESTVPSEFQNDFLTEK